MLQKHFLPKNKLRKIKNAKSCKKIQKDTKSCKKLQKNKEGQW